MELVIGGVVGYLICYYFGAKVDAFVAWVKEKYASFTK